MTYDLDALREARTALLESPKCGSADRWMALADMLAVAATDSTLLDDAALGRAVRAAAERDGPEREAMALAMPVATLLDAQAAARALVAMQEGSDGR